jgi:hypothetical protein
MSNDRDDPRRAMRELVDEFGRAADQAVKMIRHAVDDAGRRMGAAPRAGAATPPSATASGSPADAIRELARLRDEGLISEDEFQATKTRLLERM